jgi:hypothetical protein
MGRWVDLGLEPDRVSWVAQPKHNDVRDVRRVACKPRGDPTGTAIATQATDGARGDTERAFNDQLTLATTARVTVSARGSEGGATRPSLRLSLACCAHRYAGGGPGS